MSKARILWFRFRRAMYDSGLRCPRCGVCRSGVYRYDYLCRACWWIQTSADMHGHVQSENKARQPKTLFAKVQP